MKRTIAAVLFATVIGVGLADFSRWPVGPESIVHIGVAMFMSDVAESLHATVGPPIYVKADTVPLSGILEAKLALKAAFSQIGLSHRAAESTEQFTFERGRRDLRSAA